MNLETYNEFRKSIQNTRSQELRYTKMLVFSDWLEEQGSDECFGWRWMADHQFVPSCQYHKWTFLHTNNVNIEKLLPHCVPAGIEKYCTSDMLITWGLSKRAWIKTRIETECIVAKLMGRYLSKQQKLAA